MPDSASFLRPAEPLDGADLEREVAELIIEVLHLEMPVSEIDPNAPLFGEGLGLDSIDLLEIALVLGRRYGVQVRADDQQNRQTFGSLRQLVAFVAAHRAR